MHAFSTLNCASFVRWTKSKSMYFSMKVSCEWIISWCLFLSMMCRHDTVSREGTKFKTLWNNDDINLVLLVRRVDQYTIIWTIFLTDKNGPTFLCFANINIPSQNDLENRHGGDQFAHAKLRTLVSGLRTIKNTNQIVLLFHVPVSVHYTEK